MPDKKIWNELSHAREVLDRFMADGKALAAIALAADAITDALKAGNRVYACGNGGSMSDAMHFAEEMSGRFRLGRPPLAATAISDPGHITCTANDYGFEAIFSRYIEAFGRQGDVLLAISTTGNSANVSNAADAAGHRGMKVIGLTGKDGGALAPLCDIEVRAPWSDYSDRTQEIHIKVIHILVMLVEQRMAH